MDGKVLSFNLVVLINVSWFSDVIIFKCVGDVMILIKNRCKFAIKKNICVTWNSSSSVGGCFIMCGGLWTGKKKPLKVWTGRLSRLLIEVSTLLSLDRYIYQKGNIMRSIWWIWIWRIYCFLSGWGQGGGGAR